MTFVENLNVMADYTFEMVPQMVGRIAELLTSIDQKLEKLTVPAQPVDNTPELMGVKDLGAYLPSHPAPATIYGWIRENSIPHYKQGKTLMFKKSEIDKWLLRTRVKDDAQLQEEAEEWCRTHPIGWRHRK